MELAQLMRAFDSGSDITLSGWPKLLSCGDDENMIKLRQSNVLPQARLFQ